MGFETDPKMVRISVHVEGSFKDELKKLLMEFKDVFAWDYSDSDMKGIDPVVHQQHRINLKEDAVHVIQQRYRMNPNYAK